MQDNMKLYDSTDVSTENENMENITKLQANNRVKSLNPEIYQNLINSERVFSSSFDSSLSST